MLERADTAPAEITPGLLASRIPGGAAYAGVAGRTHIEAVAAADRGATSPPCRSGLRPISPTACGGLLRDHRFVVAGLPTAAKGDAVLDALLRDRQPGDLLIVVETPPRARVPQLLPAGAVVVPGLGAAC